MTPRLNTTSEVFCDIWARPKAVRLKRTHAHKGFFTGQQTSWGSFVFPPDESRSVRSRSPRSAQVTHRRIVRVRVFLLKNKTKQNINRRGRKFSKAVRVSQKHSCIFHSLHCKTATAALPLPALRAGAEGVVLRYVTVACPNLTGEAEEEAPAVTTFLRSSSMQSYDKSPSLTSPSVCGTMAALFISSQTCQGLLAQFCVSPKWGRGRVWRQPRVESTPPN